MIRNSRFVALALAVAASLLQPGAARGAEIAVLCSNGFKAVMRELVPRFEQATGHTVVVTFSVSTELERRIDTGAAFDIAVLTPVMIDSAIARGRIAGATRTALARSPIALAVRRGAPRPDIRTTDALVRTLSSAASIAFAREGEGGVFFAGVIRKLDLAEAIRSKARPTVTGDEASGMLARGDAELAVLPVSEILPVNGIEVLGVFPSDLQGYVTMVGGVSAFSAQPQAAGALMQFLAGPASLAVLKEKGMERP